MSGEASLRYLYCSPWPFFCPKCAWDIHGEKKPIPCFGQWKINAFGTVVSVWFFSAMTQSPQEARPCIWQENIMKALVFLLWSLLNMSSLVLLAWKTVKLNAPGQNLICSIVDCLDHCLHSLVNNRQPARVESLLCLPSFDYRFSILLTSVNRQSVYRKNCSLSQKAVIGSLNMLNIALINERFKPLCTARDYSKAEVQLQPQCLI